MVSMVFIGICNGGGKTSHLRPFRGVTVVNDSWVKTNHVKMKVFDVRKKARIC